MVRDDEEQNNNIMQDLNEFIGDNCRVIFIKNLHSKLYFNGKEALITSLNLYMYSAYNNYEIGVLFNEKDEKEIEKIKKYIQFLTSERTLPLIEETKIQENELKSNPERDNFESVEFTVKTKGKKWYQVETAKGERNVIAVEGVQELFVGNIYQAYVQKEYTKNEKDSHIVFKNPRNLYYLGKEE